MMERNAIFRMAIALATLSTVAIAAVGCASPLPASAVDVLDHASAFEIYALDPGADAPGADSFQGHKIVARAAINDSDAQKRIWNIVEDGMRKGGTQAKCFNPRHGVHAVKGNQIVDLVICFQCGNVDVHEGPNSTMLATADVRPLLDVEFKAAGVTTLPD